MISDSPKETDAHSQTPVTDLTRAPALVPRASGAVLITQDGEVIELATADAVHYLANKPVLVCHSAFTARRLGASSSSRHRGLFDVLELFAFVCPAQFCVPTPQGLAQALALDPPSNPEDAGLVIHMAAERLLDRVTPSDLPYSDDAFATAMTMGRAGWPWAPYVMARLRQGTSPNDTPHSKSARKQVWDNLTEWQDGPPQGAPHSEPVTPEEARQRLKELLAQTKRHQPTERRDAQSDYAATVSAAFAAKQHPGQPHIVLAEAGTGIGKTLGYIAPAVIWAERNGPGLWISTYTKNLQRQIDQELDRPYPDPQVKAQKTMIRKGRENYLCLLNYQEAFGGGDPILLGLVSRWVLHTKDGDMVGGDFPAWLATMPGSGVSADRQFAAARALSGLTDRRGECIYSACTHYRKCFIEKAIRKAKHADIVVANHALVMVQAAQHQLAAITRSDVPAPPASDQSSAFEQQGPVRFIFDEGHHVFDAADSAFSTHLTGFEMSELRRWIIGSETRRRGRTLRERLQDLLDDAPEAENAQTALTRSAIYLPGTGWTNRVTEGRPDGPGETFFALVYRQVMARNENITGNLYDLETLPWPVIDGLLQSADNLFDALRDVERPLLQLARILRRKLDDDSANLDTARRSRIEAMATGLERRGIMLVPAWQAMLRTLHETEQDKLVDWFTVEHTSGRIADIGMHRHWIDPTIPFAEHVLKSAHGAVITSATLRDRLPDNSQAQDAAEPIADWQSAEIRTGAVHLPLPVIRASFTSPFDYADQTRIVVVTDVSRADNRAVAAAYRELCLASGGGVLGLFTAIERLRQVYDRIAAPLEQAGLSLYAQHVDPMDAGTLVDIFRAEQDSCLLGTDAVRDGVDVPGRSLRLIVFDRVPWSRPSILHKARRSHFGGRYYDDVMTRLRLKQAFGRLIRRADDRGVFVILDRAMPTRLTTAFPEDVEIQRMGLKDTLSLVRAFLPQESVERS